MGRIPKSALGRSLICPGRGTTPHIRPPSARLSQERRKSEGFRSAFWIQVWTASRVIAVISNWTGLPVFCCITMAREAIWPPWDTSETRSLTRSQARSVESIARLNSARSRTFLRSCRRTRIAQMTLSLSGAFWPTSFPLFQAGRAAICEGLT